MSTPSTETNDQVEFEIDFIAASYMFSGMNYEEAREKAIEEWKKIKADGS